MTAAAPTLLRLRDVLARVGLKRSTVYARISNGSFPRPVPLGTPRAVAWVASEVDEWIVDQIRKARQPTAERGRRDGVAPDAGKRP